MAKNWIITAEKDNKYIVQVMRLSDGKRFSLSENTFHGPIKKFWVSKDLEMMVSFEEGDVACDVNINEIKDPIPDQDPCDESHTDVWARTQAIRFAEWIYVEGWEVYDGVGRWICLSQDRKVLNSEQLYNLFITEKLNNGK